MAVDSYYRYSNKAERAKWEIYDDFKSKNQITSAFEG